jgi:hypothetical protein
MAFGYPVIPRLLCNIPSSLFPMLGTEGRSKIALAMFAAINKSQNVIAVPCVTRADLSAADMTNPIMPDEHPKANAGRNARIIRATDPLICGSHASSMSC